MKAIKENKEYSITESEKKGYVDQGFDIINGEGVVIEHGRGKNIPYEKYVELETVYNELKAAYEKVAGDGLSDLSVEELKAYAESHNIDLGQATSQDGIIKKIRAVQKA